MAQLPLSASIYQFRFVLAGISPMIWRRLLVSSKTSIAQLHEYIQIAFDWSGEHLHRFRIHGKDHGIAYLGGISFDDNPYAVPEYGPAPSAEEIDENRRDMFRGFGENF